MNEVWRGRGKIESEWLSRSQNKEELAGILWLTEKTSYKQKHIGGNQVRQVTWSQTRDSLGVRQRNAHLKWWEVGNHWKFLSSGNERIYFSSSPQGRWKGLGGSALWNAGEIYLTGWLTGLGTDWIWGMREKNHFQPELRKMASVFHKISF